MAERLSAAQFHASPGVDDWRVVAGVARAHFRTRSFTRGVALVNRIEALAETANHHPDIDLRYGGVTVTLVTHDVGGLSSRDVEMARHVSTVARELGIEADASVVQDVQLTIDTRSRASTIPFWQAVLGYRADGDEDLVDPLGRGPALWFQPTKQGRTERNTLHVDVFVPPEQVLGRIDAALAAGGRLVSDAHAPAWWTLADPEGNEVDLATWQGRD